jgi:hypothetical protein
MTKKIIAMALLALLLLPMSVVAVDGPTVDNPAETVKDNWTPIQFAIWKPVQVVDETYNVYGLRMNIFYSLNKDIRGLDIGIIINESLSMYGIQFSMFLNKVTESMLGMQFGLINKAGRVGGIQIGLINDTKNLAGLQFGLLNINRNGWLPFFPMMNIGFTYTTAEEKAQAKAAQEEKKKAAAAMAEEKKAADDKKAAAAPAEEKKPAETPAPSEGRKLWESLTDRKPADKAAVLKPEQPKPEQPKPEQGKPEQGIQVPPKPEEKTGVQSPAH